MIIEINDYDIVEKVFLSCLQEYIEDVEGIIKSYIAEDLEAYELKDLNYYKNLLQAYLVVEDHFKVPSDEE